MRTRKIGGNENSPTPDLLIGETVAFAHDILADLRQAEVRTEEDDPNIQCIRLVPCGQGSDLSVIEELRTTHTVVMRDPYEASHPHVVSTFHKVLETVLGWAGIPTSAGEEISSNMCALKSAQTSTAILAIDIRSRASAAQIREAFQIEDYILRALCMQSLREKCDVNTRPVASEADVPADSASRNPSSKELLRHTFAFAKKIMKDLRKAKIDPADDDPRFNGISLITFRTEAEEQAAAKLADTHTVIYNGPYEALYSRTVECFPSILQHMMKEAGFSRASDDRADFEDFEKGEFDVRITGTKTSIRAIDIICRASPLEIREALGMPSRSLHRLCRHVLRETFDQAAATCAEHPPLLHVLRLQEPLKPAVINTILRGGIA